MLVDSKNQRFSHLYQKIHFLKIIRNIHLDFVDVHNFFSILVRVFLVDQNEQIRQTAEVLKKIT